MPGFATGTASKSFAWRLMEALGITASELDIRPTARQMLEGLGHLFARGGGGGRHHLRERAGGLRTDYLFRLANHHKAIVLGTGDLSELALGWSTYGVGDQMSHYNVNGGVPKTLIQHLIRWVSGLDDFSDQVDEVLLSILSAEISPELIPVKEGEVPQSTEKAIGPYELQDFTLFYAALRLPGSSKIAFLAHHAWADVEQDLAARVPARAATRVRRGCDSALAYRFRSAVLRLLPVQAVGDAQRAQGLARRVAEPARDWRRPRTATPRSGWPTSSGTCQRGRRPRGRWIRGSSLLRRMR